jgi:hypothetical protein
MNGKIKKAVKLLQENGYEIKAPDPSYSVKQLRIAFNAARVPVDIHFPIDDSHYKYKTFEDFYVTTLP